MKDLSNKNIIHVKDDTVEYIQFRRLLEYSDKIAHCFTLKNLNFYSNNKFHENKEKILENYREICKKLKDFGAEGIIVSDINLMFK